MTKRILDYQTNTCYFSRLLLERLSGMEIVGRIMNHGVNVKFLDGTRDIWCRDYMPIQIAENTFVGYEYVPDYLNHPIYAASQTNPARIIRELGLDVTQSGIILDGGNVVKTSRGIIMVDKVFKENSHIPKAQLVYRLETFFNDEIIFLPWDKGEKYGHADGIVREIDKGRVLMTNYHQYDKTFFGKFLKILSNHFDVEVLDYNVEKLCKYNWCYINYLRVGNKLFLPQLSYVNYSPPSCAACPPIGGNNKRIRKWYYSHIEEDDLAFEQFQSLFTGCEIIQVSCPEIVEDGGALNCISWNIKR